MKTNLTILDHIPSAFLSISHREIKDLFDSPTLIHLKGEKEPALFISILLHGNEFSGLQIIQEILKKYQTTDGYKLPRSIWLFIGNVDAAQMGVRLRDGQIDFNRAWPGTPEPNSDTAVLIQEVMDRITQNELFASIDLHNNTGQNPPYGCISVVNEKNKYLSSFFNHFAMVFQSPKGVSTMAFDDICPAITLECSTPGNEPAIKRAFELIDDLMHMDHFPEKPLPVHDLQLVKNSATIKINTDITFCFEDEEFSDTQGYDLTLVKNFDHHNFTLLEKNEVFAYTKVTKPFLVISPDGQDITEEIIQNDDGNLSLKTPLMPAMISMDKKIVLQDCLCYLLEDY
ncbi:M14 family metallopeptidase [Sulfurovum sp.]|uniref:M14 family metallopeptidase n=1 Tax=Sulfurovum sp. TaxID=1969726 RepID=UPI002867CA52|nr:M14 family metallopeptidase [Sulfurovum sp.]